jgi:hypothetical protein
VQFLANALPGFRDLRAPIITGYLWLVLTWLLVRPNLGRRPTSQLAAAAYDLANDTGPIPTALAISVAAYLLGAVSQEVSRALKRLWLTLPLSPVSGGFRIRTDDQILPSYETGQRAIEQAAATAGYDADELEALRDHLARRASEAAYEARRELDLPATLLVENQTELFSWVDRRHAESDLRLAVIPPLIALSTLLVVESSAWWLFVLPGLLVLFVQGVRRDFDAKKSIADAIRLGRISSPSASRFSDWVEETLPSELDRIRAGGQPHSLMKFPARESSKPHHEPEAPMS